MMPHYWIYYKICYRLEGMEFVSEPLVGWVEEYGLGEVE
jgi:hypothetical protein